MPNQNFRVKNGLEVGVGGTILSAFESGKVGIGTTNSRYTLEVGSVGAAGTSLFVNGGARITGILSVGQGTVVIDGNTNTITAETIVVSGNINQSGGGSYATQGYVATQLTNLNASNLSSGTVPDARFPATLPTASGANLTSLNASNLSSGTVPDARFPATLPTASGANLTSLNASNLSSGTVPDARFPATLPTASGSNLTSLNASNLSSGTVPVARITGSSGDFTVGTNLYVNGTLSVGGTSVILNSRELQIIDKDIVVGYTTDANGLDISSDTTANHGGIAVASLEGSPIINIPIQAGINSNPSTYKMLMWVKKDNYIGFGTDSWITNYPISIGNISSVQNGSKLTVGAGFTVFDTYLAATDIDARNINAGIITATSFVKSSGTSGQFLKADGSVDSNTYLTSYTETDTLDTVTGRGNSTSNQISVGDLTASAGNFTGITSFSNLTNLKQVTETSTNAFNTTLAPSSGTLTIDTSLGTVVLGDLNASVTTWAFTNVPTANSKATTITVIIDGDTGDTYGDACSVNGSAITNGVKWSGGSAPTSTNNYDILSFIIVKDSAGTINVFGSGNTNFS